MNISKLHIIILANLKDNYAKKFGDFSGKHFKQFYVPCVCLLYIQWICLLYIQWICLLYIHTYSLNIVLPGDSDSEELAFNTGDLSLVPHVGKIP